MNPERLSHTREVILSSLGARAATKCGRWGVERQEADVSGRVWHFMCLAFHLLCLIAQVGLSDI